MEKVIVVGAGLCGSLLAVNLAQKGYRVAVYERRGDIRKAEFIGGRSINLALSARGIQALELVDMGHLVKEQGIPMKGRMIHDLDGRESFFSYSGRPDEYINSISRGGLNKALLLKASEYDNISFHFNHQCEDVDFEQGRIQFYNADSGERVYDEADVIFGTDGAGSAVRQAMMKHSNQIRFDFSQSYLTHGYKELSIPPADDGGFRIDSGALHIWPRGSHMLIALPNLDGSFTVTLFQDFDGSEGLEALDGDLGLARSYFEKYFPDALVHMPDFENDFQVNPSSSLGTIKCYPWQMAGRSILMGDAAHAIVPFYGQGMNASFEDVFVLDRLMESGISNWKSLLSAFEQQRKPDADAIADLAVDNFYEMRDHAGDELFQKKVLLEKRLEKEMPDQYNSKYALVTFRKGIGYRQAMLRGRAQDAFLLDYCRDVSDINAVDLNQLVSLIDDNVTI